MCVYSSASVVSSYLQSYELEPTRLLCPWDSPGKHTGVGHHALLQGIFPSWELKPHLLPILHWKQILYHWSTGEAQFIIKVLKYEQKPSLLIKVLK